MKHYIEELKRQLHEIMELPATLGRAEEITVYADAICALHKMGSHEDGEDTAFTREDAEKWVSHMENEDGTAGAHWTMEQTRTIHLIITGLAICSSPGREYSSTILFSLRNIMACLQFTTGVNTKK